MMVFCEDHKVACEVMPTLWDTGVFEGLTVEDDAHMECELSALDWEDSDYDYDIDFG